MFYRYIWCLILISSIWTNFNFAMQAQELDASAEQAGGEFDKQEDYESDLEDSAQDLFERLAGEE